MLVVGKNIGIVQQEIYLLDDSVKKNVAFGLEDSQLIMKK